MKIYGIVWRRTNRRGGWWRRGVWMLNMIRVFVTKYWQTKGIQEMEAERDTNYPRFLFVGNGQHRRIVSANEWFQSEEDAVHHVEALKKKRIASLEKQIERLRAMTVPIHHIGDGK